MSQLPLNCQLLFLTLKKSALEASQDFCTTLQLSKYRCRGGICVSTYETREEDFQVFRIEQVNSRRFWPKYEPNAQLAGKEACCLLELWLGN